MLFPSLFCSSFSIFGSETSCDRSQQGIQTPLSWSWWSELWLVRATDFSTVCKTGIRLKWHHAAWFHQSDCLSGCFIHPSTEGVAQLLHLSLCYYCVNATVPYPSLRRRLQGLFFIAGKKWNFRQLLQLLCSSSYRRSTQHQKTNALSDLCYIDS